MPNMQVIQIVNFIFLKKKLLNSLIVDTLIHDKGGRITKISSKYYLIMRILIASYEIQHYLILKIRYNLLLLLLLLSNLFKRYASLAQQYAGLQEGRVQRK